MSGEGERVREDILVIAEVEVGLVAFGILVAERNGTWLGVRRDRWGHSNDQPLRTQLEQGRFLAVVRVGSELKGGLGHTCRT